MTEFMCVREKKRDYLIPRGWQWREVAPGHCSLHTQYPCSRPGSDLHASLELTISLNLTTMLPQRIPPLLYLLKEVKTHAQGHTGVLW